MTLDFDKYPSSPELSPYVKFYYSIKSKGKSQQLQVFNNHPQGSVDIMFHLDGTVTFSTKESQATPLSGIFVAAQQEQHFDVSFGENAHIVGIVFKAESFNKFLKLPLSELANKCTVVTDEVPERYLDLYHQLGNAKSVEMQMKQIDGFMKKELFRIASFTNGLDRLVDYIRQQNGTISTKELANHANMSIRTLQRRLKEHIGISPKSYSKIVRFNYTLLAIKNYPEKTIGEILALGAYYDQAHFLKDFKTFTGKSPSNFIKNNTDLSDFFLID